MLHGHTTRGVRAVFPTRPGSSTPSFSSASRAASCSAAFFEPPSPDTELLAVDEGRAREVALVRWPLGRENGVDHLPPAAGERLLQLRLVVDVRVQRVVDAAGERVDDRGLDVREPVLEEERAERRLEERGQHVAVLREPLELVHLEAVVVLDEQPAELELARHHRAARA